MGGERPGGLDAEPGRDAGDEDALAGEIDAGEDVVGGGFGAELGSHGRLPFRLNERSITHYGGKKISGAIAFQKVSKPSAR